MKKIMVIMCSLAFVLGLASCDDGGDKNYLIYSSCGTTDEDAANADAANISASDFTFASGDSQLSVTGNFTLPDEGACGSTLAWTSADADTVSITGTAATVTRPGTVGSGDKNVLLAATVTKGEAVTTREIAVNVTREKWVQDAYLKASNPGIADSFGSSVAVSGDIIAVGAYMEESSATGIINADGEDSVPGTAQFSGAVYVFRRSGENWVQDAYLKASNTGENDNFGICVAVEGDTIAVGAPLEDSQATGVYNIDSGDNDFGTRSNSGAVYVFRRDAGTGNWIQDAYLKASNAGDSDHFGWSVAVDGGTVVVSASREDCSETDIDNDDGQPEIGDTNDNDDLTEAGAVYVFTRNSDTGIWAQDAYLKASNAGDSDHFGGAVAVDGDTVAVGATAEDSTATEINNTAGSPATNVDGAADSGAVYVFKKSDSTGNWTQDAYFKASNAEAGDVFGSSVSLNGNILAVGTYTEDSGQNFITNGDSMASADDIVDYDSGAVYVFKRSGNGWWSQDAYLKPSNCGETDHFGIEVAVSGDIIVAGASYESGGQSGITNDDGQADETNSYGYSGAAYIFRKVGAVWVQDAYLKASNRGLVDYFSPCAIDGDLIVVGASGEPGGPGIINADGHPTVDEANADVNGSGAAYVFTVK